MIVSRFEVGIFHLSASCSRHFPSTRFSIKSLVEERVFVWGYVRWLLRELDRYSLGAWHSVVLLARLMGVLVVNSTSFRHLYLLIFFIWFQLLVCLYLKHVSLRYQMLLI